MITPEQVADLREGDVVELGFASGAIVRGPLVENRHTGSLEIADAGWAVRQRDDAMSLGLERYAETLTVVSRAPRLYVNHPRTEAMPGDVAGPAEPGANDGQTWHFLDGIGSQWFDKRGYGLARADLPARLRLLVDGTTGQVVP